MDFAKDLSKRLDDLTRGIDKITEKVDGLASDAERQHAAFKIQLRDFQQSTTDIKNSCDHVRDEVVRLARDLSNVPLTTQRYGSQMQAQSQPQSSGINPEQLAWAISQAVSQAVSQSVAVAVRQALNPNQPPSAFGPNAGLQHQA